MIKTISLLLTVLLGFLVASLILVVSEAIFGAHANFMILVIICTMVCFLIVSVKSFNPIHNFLIGKFSKLSKQ